MESNAILQSKCLFSILLNKVVTIFCMESKISKTIDD